MVFGHYCSGPDRSQRWSALYQFAESCSTLLCLSLTPLAFLVPGAETPAWYLFSYSASEVCTPFTLSAHSAEVLLVCSQSTLGVYVEGKNSACSRGHSPREDVLTPCLLGRYELDVLVFSCPHSVWSQSRSPISIVRIVLSSS